MSDQQGQHEPTMEEILASIRRIISEDEQPADTPADEARTDDVLELTEMVPEDQPPPPTSEPPFEPEPEPETWRAAPEAEAEPEPEPEPDPGEALLSAAAAAASASAFAGLMNGRSSLDRQTRVSSGPDLTLEDIVREMLRPMLKEWLDDHLPGLVERLVRKEIERISRNG